MSWQFRVRGIATNVRTLIEKGEDSRLEFKQSLEVELRTGARDSRSLDGVLKTVAAFLNTDGGTLLIGVSDSGQITGLKQDFGLLGKRQNADGFEQKLRNLLRSHLKPLPLRSVAIGFEAFPEGTICRVDIGRSSNPVYLDEKELYVRDGNTTRKLEGPDLGHWLVQNTRARRRFISIAVGGITLIVIFGYYLLSQTVLAVPIRPVRGMLDEPLKACAVPVPPPQNPEARQLYTGGCRKIKSLEYPAAREMFEQAASIEPENASAHVALASALSWLGYDEAASLEASKALDLSQNFSPEATLWIKGTCYEIAGDFDEAAKAYRALWKLSPDNLNYGLQLAMAQSSAGDGQAALATIDSLKKLPPPVGEDPRIDLQEADIAQHLDDFELQRKAATVALNKSKSRQERLLAAEAKRWLGMAYRQLGDSGARPTLKDAKDTFETLGDHLGAALVQQEIAEMLQEQGDLDEASVVYNELVRFFKKIGNKQNLADVLDDIAELLTAKGDVVGAIQAYDDTMDAAKNIRDKSGYVTALTRKGDLLVWKGDLAAAKQLYEQSLSLAHDIKNKTTEADALDSLASMLIKMGDLGGAAKECREIATVTAPQGTKRSQAGTWRSVIELALETGNNVEAEKLARQNVEQHGQIKSPSDARDNTVLARALLGQGKLPQAKIAITRAQSILENNKDLHLRLEAAITAAQIRAALGDDTNAQRDVRNVLESTQRVGFFDLYLEARLALGKLQLREAGGFGREGLDKLQKDASAKGFDLIARKAANAKPTR